MSTAVDRRLHRRVEQIMGMPISLAVRGDVRTAILDAVWDQVVAELREVDRVFSPYRDDSVITRLDRGEIRPADCPAEVGEVLDLGRRAETDTGGAFSVHLPTANGRRLDPSGVVKGWAVERAARRLHVLDADFCLSAGGDMVCHLGGSTAPPWRIGIEHPLDPARLIAVLPVGSAAVATSGTARRGQHIIDARTGEPPTGIASVTVITGSLTEADIDATCAFLQGEAAADWLSHRPGRLALVVRPDGSTTTVDTRSRQVAPAAAS
jgi:thiamine biosynthesis lipoprotein